MHRPPAASIYALPYVAVLLRSRVVTTAARAATAQVRGVTTAIVRRAQGFAHWAFLMHNSLIDLF